MLNKFKRFNRISILISANKMYENENSLIKDQLAEFSWYLKQYSMEESERIIENLENPNDTSSKQMLQPLYAFIIYANSGAEISLGALKTIKNILHLLKVSQIKETSVLNDIAVHILSFHFDHNWTDYELYLASLEILKVFFNRSLNSIFN